MKTMSLAEIARAVGGRLHRADGTELVSGGVEFDSRAIGAGDLFVAIPGERVDGHDYAAGAVAAGAVGVLAAREVDAPAVIVPPRTGEHSSAYALAGDSDGSGAAVLAAFGALARHVVDELGAHESPGLTVVGLTGSAGKTTTKDLLAQLLGRIGPTVAPPGSFNNELGHPWTVLRADEHTRNLVLELSARGSGHIAELCRIAPPRIGVVLNVGTSHLGEFGSREGIAAAKGELVESLPAAEDGGVAVLNADDPLVAEMAARTAARVVLFGEHPDARVRATELELDDAARPSFLLHAAGVHAPVQLPLHGAHQVANALAAAAVALELGMSVPDTAAALSAAAPVSGKRMQVSTRADGVTLINDAYNASPEAVRSALKSLATMSRAGEGRRSWAVLGPMSELGDQAAEVHDEIGRLAVRLDINRLVVVGEQAKPLHQGACLEGSWGEESVLVPDVDAAVRLLAEQLRPGDVVLVKGANAFALWRIADALLAEPTSIGGAAR
ncbi:UDP-N-acetylmuramoyl-tripeptide--D-alanyl-D-alanine ligase [Tamaricihabitans halophyticus]|uniref:UDP-N-acetylmuramoyl-tripeptide--D-alanyl-D-alanine ligase n=1 Tax=Tamaricihabitans halophyticus TaxID=1262583 RepID=A0A4R2Q942_9PSEU|nr:UDP-N-acetylmuramoyl-tripeptide--D-alanyl-D-alanine ligase [Tamaricihabitans halophyticus]TCP45402.1 UDP-N-acetylmuramoyl-tripeptide--D-alanyl-D-alanine ligase [Tamaricihabitans halophyticus]